MVGMSEPLRVLSRAEWTERQAAHEARAQDLTREHLERVQNREKHPVWDFLHTYYSYKPAILRRWHPGAGVALADAHDSPHTAWRWYEADSDGTVQANADAFLSDRAGSSFIAGLLASTAERPGKFGCFGMHEWAMVYKQAEHRHEVPLRLGQAGTDAVVEAHDLRCTHFDAYRFFTPEATPRNALPLLRVTQAESEQPGCLHAGMDLYKWAIKLGPLVPGEILLDTFELARDIRQLDMEASPYDLRDWGFAPVHVETAEGKAIYVARQRAFAQRGNALRERILAALPQRILVAA